MTWARQLQRFRPDVVLAGASTLVALAEECCGGRAGHVPRLIFSDSEPLTPTMRALIRTGLGGDPVDVFGLVELSDFAWQCEARDGYHVSADSHLVEVLAPQGSLVVTDLGLWGTPVIRYETGDTAEAEHDPCGCGRTLPRLRRIEGRVIDSLVLTSGRRIFWPFFHEVLGAIPGLRQWRVVAKTGAPVHVQVCADLAVVPMVRRALVHALSEAADWSVESVSDFSCKPGEKRRLIVTEA